MNSDFVLPTIALPDQESDAYDRLMQLDDMPLSPSRTDAGYAYDEALDEI
jgi:hypothetical protein